MANNTPNQTSFNSENQPTKRRGKSAKTKLLEALERRGINEEGFYDLLLEKAIDEDNSIAMGEVLKRVSPIAKAVAPMVEFELTATTPHEKAFQILDGIANSQIPPDIGTMLITSIKSTVDIEEFTDLKERIEKLEAALNVN